MNPNFSDELISAYLDGELTASERAAVEQVLATSAEHRQMLEELRLLRGELQALPRVRLPENFADAVLRKAGRQMLAASGGAAENMAANKSIDNVPTAVAPATAISRRTGNSWKAAVVALTALAGSLLLLIALPPLSEEHPVTRVDPPAVDDRDVSQDRAGRDADKNFAPENTADKTKRRGFPHGSASDLRADRYNKRIGDEKAFARSSPTDGKPSESDAGARNGVSGEGRRESQKDMQSNQRSAAPRQLHADADATTMRQRGMEAASGKSDGLKSGNSFGGSGKVAEGKPSASGPARAGSSRFAESGEGKPAGLAKSEAAKSGSKDGVEREHPANGAGGKANAAPAEGKIASTEAGQGGAGTRSAGTLSKGSPPSIAGPSIAGPGIVGPGGASPGGAGLGAGRDAGKGQAHSDLAQRKQAVDFADEFQVGLRSGQRDFFVQIEVTPEEMKRWVAGTSLPAEHFYFEVASLGDAAPQSNSDRLKETVDSQASNRQAGDKSGADKSAGEKQPGEKSKTLAVVPSTGLAKPVDVPVPSGADAATGSDDRRSLALAPTREQLVLVEAHPAQVVAALKELAGRTRSLQMVAVPTSGMRVMLQRSEVVELHARSAKQPEVLQKGMPKTADLAMAKKQSDSLEEAPKPKSDAPKQAQKQVEPLATPSVASALPASPPSAPPQPLVVQGDSLNKPDEKKLLDPKSPKSSSLAPAVERGYLAKPPADDSKLAEVANKPKLATEGERLARGTVWNLDAETLKLRSHEESAQPRASQPPAQAPASKAAPRQEDSLRGTDVADKLSADAQVRVRVLFIVREAAK